MELIVIMGPQAVGKMTVGKELEKRIDAKLLYNHQTIDLYANFLGYSKEAFRLSDETRKNLFRSFVQNNSNTTNGIIFTVVVSFGQEEDRAFLKEISDIFLEAGGEVTLIELEAPVEIRLERNIAPDRLAAKPSKRDTEFSRQELLTSLEKHRLNSLPGEIEALIPSARYLKIDNTNLSAEKTAQQIYEFMTQ